MCSRGHRREENRVQLIYVPEMGKKRCLETERISQCDFRFSKQMQPRSFSSRWFKDYCVYLPSEYINRSLGHIPPAVEIPTVIPTGSSSNEQEWDRHSFLHFPRKKTQQTWEMACFLTRRRGFHWFSLISRTLAESAAVFTLYSLYMSGERETGIVIYTCWEARLASVSREKCQVSPSCPIVLWSVTNST